MGKALMIVAAVGFGCCLLYRIFRRLQLSKAKHPSLRGHVKMARRVARLLPFYEYGADRFFVADGAPAEVGEVRRRGFFRMAADLGGRAPETLAMTAELPGLVSDAAFVDTYRVPFQFRRFVAENLRVGAVMEASRGNYLRDLDGNWSRDLTGGYGVNVLGSDFYKGCIDRAVERVGELGPVLGPYHPVVLDNARRLKKLSKLDEVSFHMSGTEAVMQAVRLARYHTGRSHIVRFCGSYHGWWDGVQVGVGNPRPAREVYTLKEADQDTLRVLRTRNDIACVLINPLQALHLNGNAPSDSTLVLGERSAGFDKESYVGWLEELRAVCSERGIVFILDDVFMGFRVARGGSQEYFGVRADLVTYGKTLGGGLPVGVVCGKRHLMQRFRPERPADICFARGTFNSHPYVMAAMNEFLVAVDSRMVRRGYVGVDELWDRRAEDLNRRLADRHLPVRVRNLVSVWTTLYTDPGRYRWMFQYYLRREGLTLSWVGTGRFIFSHDYSDSDFEDVAHRFVAAAEAMEADGWFWTDEKVNRRALKKQVRSEIVRTMLSGGDRVGTGELEVPSAPPRSRSASEMAS